METRIIVARDRPGAYHDATPMLPIHKLLSRIRWDRRFRNGRFAIGYYDRRERQVLVVPLETIRFPPGAPRVFELWDEEGQVHRIPFHRVRRVYRDGRLIWERRPSGEPPTAGCALRPG